jgi:hypothetical protein
MHDMLTEYLDMGAEMVCTCTLDVDGMLGMLNSYGMMPSAEDLQEFFGSCSEAAAAI